MKVLLGLFMTICTFGSQPGGRQEYPAPDPFRIESSLVYGHSEAELYLSVQPLYAVSDAELQLVSSHASLIISLPSEFVSGRAKLKGPSRFLIRLLRTGDFSMASITLQIQHKRDKEALRGYVSNHLKDIFINQEATAALLHRVDMEAPEALQTLAVYLYAKDFSLSP